MKNLNAFGLLAFSFLFLFACGGNQSTDTAEAEMQAAMEEMDEENNDQVTNLNDAVKQAKKAMEDAGMGQSSDPVNFRELKKLLPESLRGLELTDQSGETTGAMGFNISQAEVEFSGDDGKRITISIFDTGGIAMAAMGLAAWANVTIDKEDSNGYERTTTIKGYKAYEKFNTRNQDGEISIFASDRFIVKVEGQQVDMDDLRAALDKIDLSGLKGLI